MPVAVIGAGLAGSACARALQSAGETVVVFDKGRGPGGRASTRRADTPLGEARFDHGAQYANGAHGPLWPLLEDALIDGHAARWTGRFVEIGAGGVVTDMEPKSRIVGAPGMNAIVRAAQDGLDVRFSQRAQALTKDDAGWRIAMEDGGAEGPFDAIALAIPAPQAAELLKEPAPDLAAVANGVVAEPNWTLMAAFEAPLPLDFDAAKVAGDGPVAWVASETSKPARPDVPAYTAQASIAWSKAHLEDDASTVAVVMLDALLALCPSQPPAAVHASAHRWRYAYAAQPVGRPCQWDRAAQLGVCGDWFLGPKLEHAWASGQALALAMSVKL